MCCSPAASVAVNATVSACVISSAGLSMLIVGAACSFNPESELGRATHAVRVVVMFGLEAAYRYR